MRHELQERYERFNDTVQFVGVFITRRHLKIIIYSEFRSENPASPPRGQIRKIFSKNPPSPLRGPPAVDRATAAVPARPRGPSGGGRSMTPERGRRPASRGSSNPAVFLTRRRPARAGTENGARYKQVNFGSVYPARTEFVFADNGRCWWWI
ncbi:hypothetical protein EVAR_45343_1 [Eumeta japonica]|uniref:Uncharacterized protein n=1 Tax=Eumeta variegata TaxID=151549 RepID=A0A4C1XQ19_EUMVA|nr:hypothetical protein EVAR_45343_1 [Eumeta japonica]